MFFAKFLDIKNSILTESKIIIFKKWLCGSVVQGYDSCFGCRRSRVQIPAEPIYLFLSFFLRFLFLFLPAFFTHLRITYDALINYFSENIRKNHLFSCEKFEVIWERRPETAKTSVVKKSSKVLRSYGSVHKQCRSNCRLYLESVSEKMYFGNLFTLLSPRF